jgi:hypothetical protein
MKYILLACILVSLFSACAPLQQAIFPTPTMSAQTAEAKTATVAANRTKLTNLYNTEVAKPQRSTSTPMSPFDACVNSGVGVRYVIYGEDVNGVSLTWQNDTGGTSQGDYGVPYCQTYSNFYSGDFLYISAQIISPTSSYAGSIKCRIYDGSHIIAEADADGFASIATCSESKP